MVHTDNLSALVSGVGNVLGNDGGKLGAVGQLHVEDRTVTREVRREQIEPDDDGRTRR